MNVLWEGHPTQFKNIDDPAVGPRLNATLEAHKLLWSIRLLVRSSLTPSQRQLASDFCGVQLLSHSRERPEKLRALYGQVIEKTLAAEKRRLPPSAMEYQERVGRILQELTVPAQDGDSFSRRLRSAMDLNFPAS